MLPESNSSITSLQGPIGDNTLFSGSQSQKGSNPVKKAVLVVVALLSVGLAGFLAFKLYQNRSSFMSYAGLAVDVKNGPADVYVDGVKLGQTPFESKSIKTGTHTVKIQKDDLVYETSAEFTKSSQVVINRDLGVSKAFSSGQAFWLDSKDLSSKLNVISTPSDATVYIDDVESGKTPYTSTILTDGEYDLKIQKDGYEAQTARIKIQKGLKLNVSVQLFLLPVPEKLTALSGSKTVYDLSSDINDLTLDVPSWVKGVIYMTESRGSSTRFSYYVDYSGNVFDSSGKQQPKDVKIELKAGDSIAYLGKKSDNGTTDFAKLAFANFVGLDTTGIGTASTGSTKTTETKVTTTTTPTVTSVVGQKVKVSATPTGWLRVRKTPGLSGAEISKLNVGDTATVLEEKAGWYRINTLTAGEGWISSAYTQVVKE